jgi:hypothetical protein
MSLSAAIRVLRPRWAVGLLALHLAITGTAIPCLLVCAAQAQDEHAASCHGHDADHSDPCATDSPCMQDQAPAVIALADDAGPPLDLGIVAAGLPAWSAPFAGAPALRLLALPDRSPPVPPGFVVLRI